MASLVIAIGIVAWIAARAYSSPPAEDGGGQPHLTRDVGPRSNWPWLSPSLGLLGLLVSLLSIGLADGANQPDAEDCLDVCVGPNGADVITGLRAVGLAAAAAAGIIGALALRDPAARVVAAIGLALAGAAALVVIPTV